MLYFHGDIHGNPIGSFSFKVNPRMRELTEEDYLFVLGDCGVPWNQYTIKNDIYVLNWLNNQKYHTIFIAGNHDNYDLIEQMPRKSFFGGVGRTMVYQDIVFDNITYIDYPTYIEIQDKKILIIPGAESHDISDGIINGYDLNWRKLYKAKQKAGQYFCRVSHITWWAQEQIKEQAVLDLLEYIPHTVDYILSHEAPATQIRQFCLHYKITKGEFFLEDIKNIMIYKMWLHGHLHQYMPNAFDNITGLYNDLLDEKDIDIIIQENKKFLQQLEERMKLYYDK